MTTLSITRGPQGAGKTELAYSLVRSEPDTARFSRDDFRRMVFGQSGILSYRQENLITELMTACAEVGLRKGWSPIIDATHGRVRDGRRWADFAHAHGAQFRCLDVVATEEQCIANVEARAAAGGHAVPAEAIKDYFRRFPPPWPPITSTFDRLDLTPYVPDVTKPRAIIVDLDGTLADNSWRSPFDYTRVLEDPVIEATKTLVNAAAWHYDRDHDYDTGNDGINILIFSGRDDICIEDCAQWLDNEEIAWDELSLRDEGDKRPDAVVKYKMFDEVRDRYHIIGVIDDRQQVVRMWHALGLTVFRVGDPDASF
ncbi:AAA family ATPase [Nocardia brasiliensis]|uniref:phosphatase domain-containing protein n=1 Tax=Nocardia brasiliensis TaxID=37326 RepID=UPI002458D6AC|nr:AAA family ATPase [Nocardia brasiliensis]